MNRAAQIEGRRSTEMRSLIGRIRQRRWQTRWQGRRLLMAIAASLAVPYLVPWVLVICGWPKVGASSMSTAFAAAGVSLLVWSYTVLRAVFFGARATELYLTERRLRALRPPLAGS